MKTQKGFTLIELLVVMSIISLLSSIIMSFTGEAREDARISAGIKFAGYMERAAGGIKIGEWAFDEGNEGQLVTNVIDSSYNTAPIVRGNPTYSDDVPDSSLGSASIYFDGSDSLRVASDISNTVYNFGTNKNFGVGAWFKTDSTGYRRIVSNGHIGYNAGYLIQMFNGLIRTGLASDTGSDTYIQTADSFNDNKWHYVFVLFNQKDKKIKVYIDGKPENISKVGGCGIVLNNVLDYSSCVGPVGYNSLHELCIGAGGSSCNAEYFIGYIDNVVVYEDPIME
jgi:prepilin-type N-terminal cleavage/methylation domain-containing protein